MKLLWLGNSDDLPGPLPESQLMARLVATRFEEELGEPVELQVRAVLPAVNVAALVDRWMTQFEPDLVLIRNTYYWIGYPSVPSRVRRVLGPLGGPFARLGKHAAGTTWLGHSKPFHMFRWAALRTIGADPTMDVDDLIEWMSAITRAVVRHEDAVPAVLGPEANLDFSFSRWSAEDIETRRTRWHQAMKRLCSELSIEYLGWDEPVYKTRIQEVGGDGVHITPAEHQFRANFLFELLLRAWTNAGRRPESASMGEPA